MAAKNVIIDVKRYYIEIVQLIFLEIVNYPLLALRPDA